MLHLRLRFKGWLECLSLLVKQCAILGGVLLIAQVGVALVVELTVGYLELPEETPHLVITPVDNGVDSNEVRISLRDVTSGLLSEGLAVGVVFSGPHDDVLKVGGLAEIGEFECVFLRGKLMPLYVEFWVG